MSDVATDTPVTEQVCFSNTSIVRDPDGELHLYVGSEKVIGLANLNCQNGFWGFAIPTARVKVCERVPAQPVYEYNNNVLPFAPKAAMPESPKTSA